MGTKKNSITATAVSSAICLLPVFFALAVYKNLPEQIPMHWGFDGKPTWYAPKAAAIWGLPLFFVLLNIVYRAIIRKTLDSDPQRVNHSKELRVFTEWLIPILSLIIIPLMLYSAMKEEISMHIIVTGITALMGAIFLICGNYLNKNRQNNLIGIRVRWTLNDPDNWNKTHRMAGFLWFVGGIIIIILAFLPLGNTLQLAILLTIIALLSIAPILYSYSLYKKSKNV